MLYGTDLEAMVCTACQCQSSTLYFHSRCHPDAPSWVSYHAGVITVACSVCDKVVATVAVEHCQTIGCDQP